MLRCKCYSKCNISKIYISIKCKNCFKELRKEFCLFLYEFLSFCYEYI